MGSETAGGRWMEVVMHEASMPPPNKSIQLESSSFQVGSLPSLACRTRFVTSVEYDNNTSYGP